MSDPTDLTLAGARDALRDGYVSGGTRRNLAWVQPHLERRRRGEKHPVHDFLFTYYSQRPAQLRRWHPGLGVELEGAGAIRFEDPRLPIADRWQTWYVTGIRPDQPHRHRGLPHRAHPPVPVGAAVIEEATDLVQHPLPVQVRDHLRQGMRASG